VETIRIYGVLHMRELSEGCLIAKDNQFQEGSL